MPSVKVFLALSSSVRLLEHASGARIQAPGFAKCEYEGPTDGPPFKISFKLDQPGNCDFMCTKTWPQEFDSVLMPKLFDAEFVPASARKGAFCKCNLHDGPTTIIRFFENTGNLCTPKKCWQKYLTALNYGVDDALQVKRDTLNARCKQCENEADCQPEFNLVHVDTLAREMRALQQTQLAAVSTPELAAGSAPTAVENALPQAFVAFEAAMRDAGIILDDGTDSTQITRHTGLAASPAEEASLGSPSFTAVGGFPASWAAPAPLSVDMEPCGSKTVEGPFPNQCLVTPGESGEEWREQLRTQGCSGNQFVVQIEDGVAVAITVDEVEELLSNVMVSAAPSRALAAMGVDQWDEVPFTDNFRILKRGGVVRIGISDLREGAEPTLNYLVTDDTRTTSLPGTQGLFLMVEAGRVTVTQHKPEEEAPSAAWSFFHTVTYTQPLPSIMRNLLPLNPEKYARPCTTA